MCRERRTKIEIRAGGGVNIVFGPKTDP
jgi:hypothetical protein